MLKKSIFSKIFGLIVIMSLIVGVFILVVTIRERTKTIEEALVKENKLLAGVAAKSIETGYLANLWPFETLKKISDSEEILFLWIVKPNGEIFLADNPEMHSKVIDDDFLGTQEIRVRDGNYHGQRIKLIVHPLQIEVGKKPWSFYLGVSLKSAEVAARKTIFTGVGFFILTLIFITFVSFYFSKGITQPLEQFKEGAEIIGKGNLDYRIKVKTGDEIEELAESFNRMTEDLKKSRASSEEAKTVLEIKVEARTKELNELVENLEAEVQKRTEEIKERMADLERFNKLVTGRELKMIELKKELKALKTQLRNEKL